MYFYSLPIVTNNSKCNESFYLTKNTEYNNYGTAQLVLLGKYLKENGFILWSLGHNIPYKKALGAEICERECFLERWFTSNNEII